ncbi:MAG: hypothetical protein WAN44_11095 [Propionibacteriaceae bacterium]|jgi:hypothetical protein
MNQMTFAIVAAIILGAGTTIALTIEMVRVKTRGMRAHHDHEAAP